MFLLIFFNSIDRDFRRFSFRKSKHACANTAECYAFKIILNRFVQAGKITAFQQFAILLCQITADYRPDGMDNILTRQVIGRRNLRLTCRFIISLRFHQLITGITKL